MSFRVNSVYNVPDVTQYSSIKRDEKPKIYTQEDIDLIDEKYKEKENKMKRLIEEPANPLLYEYKKKLLSNNSVFEKEMIFFDKNTNLWKIQVIKE